MFVDHYLNSFEWKKKHLRFYEFWPTDPLKRWTDECLKYYNMAPRKWPNKKSLKKVLSQFGRNDWPTGYKIFIIMYSFVSRHQTSNFSFVCRTTCTVNNSRSRSWSCNIFLQYFFLCRGAHELQIWEFLLHEILYVVRKFKIKPMSVPLLIKNLWMNVFNEWMNEWMHKWMNENECGNAWKVIGMKKYVRISRFAHF